LESVFSQTVLPSEIIISDDCSSDHTLDLVESLAGRCPVPLRLLRATRNSGGPGRPLNAGIRIARGELIAVIEQDDLMKPVRIEKQLLALEHFPESMLSIGRYELIAAGAAAIPQCYEPGIQFKYIGAPDFAQIPDVFLVPPRDVIYGLIRFNFAISNSNLTFHKRLWKRIGGFSETIKTHCDFDFMIKAVPHTPLSLVNEVVLEYRFLPASLNRKNADLSSQEGWALRRDLVLRHPESAGEHFWPCYWRTRADGSKALSQGQILSALSLYWKLFQSGAFVHHLLARRRQA
jgi:glycosyltransferase involved in cell wall biosynthesis